MSRLFPGNFLLQNNCLDYVLFIIIKHSTFFHHENKQISSITLFLLSGLQLKVGPSLQGGLMEFVMDPNLQNDERSHTFQEDSTGKKPWVKCFKLINKHEIFHQHPNCRCYITRFFCSPKHIKEKKEMKEKLKAQSVLEKRVSKAFSEKKSGNAWRRFKKSSTVLTNTLFFCLNDKLFLAWKWMKHEKNKLYGNEKKTFLNKIAGII